MLIDPDAAGHGWFVDATPHLDEEFLMSAGNRHGLGLSGEAARRIDLLTVIQHELGHLLGLEDLALDLDDLMAEALAAGIRRKPPPTRRDAATDAVFALGQW